jgi:hypothetical protein
VSQYRRQGFTNYIRKIVLFYFLAIVLNIKMDFKKNWMRKCGSDSSGLGQEPVGAVMKTVMYLQVPLMAGNFMTS